MAHSRGHVTPAGRLKTAYSLLSNKAQLMCAGLQPVVNEVPPGTVASQACRQKGYYSGEALPFSTKATQLRGAPKPSAT